MEDTLTWPNKDTSQIPNDVYPHTYTYMYIVHVLVIIIGYSTIHWNLIEKENIQQL